MKNNKKRITCGLAAALMVGTMAFSLTGCGGDNKKSKEEQALQQGLNLEDKARENMNQYNSTFQNADDMMTIEQIINQSYWDIRSINN